MVLALLGSGPWFDPQYHQEWSLNTDLEVGQEHHQVSTAPKQKKQAKKKRWSLYFYTNLLNIKKEKNIFFLFWGSHILWNSKSLPTLVLRAHSQQSSGNYGMWEIEPGAPTCKTCKTFRNTLLSGPGPHQNRSLSSKSALGNFSRLSILFALWIETLKVFASSSIIFSINLCFSIVFNLTCCLILLDFYFSSFLLNRELIDDT